MSEKGQCQYAENCEDKPRCELPSTRKYGDNWFCEEHGARNKPNDSRSAPCSDCESYRQKAIERATLAGDLLSENRRLKKALCLAARWGVNADGFSAEVSSAIKDWIDGDMIGEPPAQPDYYPNATAHSSTERK